MKRFPSFGGEVALFCTKRPYFGPLLLYTLEEPRGEACGFCPCGAHRLTWGQNAHQGRAAPPEVAQWGRELSPELEDEEKLSLWEVVMRSPRVETEEHWGRRVNWVRGAMEGVPGSWDSTNPSLHERWRWRYSRSSWEKLSLVALFPFSWGSVKVGITGSGLRHRERKDERCCNGKTSGTWSCLAMTSRQAC